MPRIALLVLHFVLLVAVGGCASNSGATVGRGSLASVPDELRGVWDGLITLSTRTAQVNHARLILGKEPVLIIRDNGKVKLIPREQEREPEHFMRPNQRVTVTFDAQPLEGRLAVRKVRAQSPRVDAKGKPESKIMVNIELEPPPGIDPRYAGGAGGEMEKPVPQAAAYGAGPRSPYFAYADWRSPGWNGPSASGASDGLRTRVTRLAKQLNSFGRWKCLAGQTFTVVPGEIYEWERPGNEWVGDRLYAICAHEDDNLAIRVGNKARGAPFHILGSGTLLDYPAMVLSPYLAGWSRHYFSFQHRWDDPDTALDDESRAKPIKVTLLIFGRSLGDQGPGFDFNSLPE